MLPEGALAVPYFRSQASHVLGSIWRHKPSKEVAGAAKSIAKTLGVIFMRKKALETSGMF